MPKTISFSTKEWFFENMFPGVRRCKTDAFRIKKSIFRGKTKYQDIFIFESPGFGKILVLDGIIQLSESDEFIYHEIIAHVPLMTHPNPKRMLVIGGGDGGVLREAVKHPLTDMYFVDIDEQVVEMAKKHMRFINKGSFDDKRVKINFEDGRTFIRKFKNFFDVIVVDSTDPVGPGKVLFEGSFYKDVFAALKSDGIAMFQLGPFLDFNLIVRPTAKKLAAFAKYINPVRLAMPSYSCGSEYCFMMASKKVNPVAVPLAVLKKRLHSRLGQKAKTLRYYTPEVHLASLAMPKLWQLK